ncbi:MAG: LysM peptidoglycan-binding domain-containing protein [Candidatus Omnitrophica bacterium]|nr:LysM peptidoglycan-binding domain-containing protein [Candidatus Omnitrophota bacterium]
MNARYAIRNSLYATLVFSVFILSGCVVRSYPVTRDRVDQDLTTGNRGYLQGKMPSGEEMERKAIRTTKTVEIELYPLIKFGNKNKAKTTETMTPEKSAPAETEAQAPTETLPSQGNTAYESYTVQKNDTLQKISQKFYGTTKRWHKLFEANKDKMKTPNSLRPGQVLNIPVEANKETKENLK